MKFTLDCGVNDTQGRCIKNTNYKYLNGNTARNYAAQTGFYKVGLVNGVSLWFGFYIGKQVDFFIDINGTKPPNTIGRDLFAMTYILDVGLVPDGHEMYDDTPYTKNCKLSSSGWGCAYYIFKYGNMNYLKK